MQVEVIDVLKPFLAFASSSQLQAIHNMLVLMFDLCFKKFQLIWDYVGIELAMQVVVEYDKRILMLLM
jgi:hypothetical protein